MSKTFLHVDMDAFFAAVEQHDHPDLRGKPVVVGAPPNQRGVVAAASYEARKYGIHSAMPSREAGKRCPFAIFLPVNGERYHEVSEQIFRIFERFTPFIEPLSIDEAFLDVTGVRRLFGTGREIALKIKNTIHKETGLTASVGVAVNKFLAKLASGLDKPDGLTVMPDTPEDIMAFLAPLPVSKIWGVGKVTQQDLEKAGIHTINQLQAASADKLTAIVGRNSAEYLLALACGLDSREIELDREEKSMSREYTFPKDCTSPEKIEKVLFDLVEDVGSRLRAAGKYASLAHLKLRWQGFKTITRQKPLERPCCDDFSLMEIALILFRSQKLAKPVRLIGFGVSRLTAHSAEQLSLFNTDIKSHEQKEKLSRTIDAIREKFGAKTIRRATSTEGQSADS